MELLTVQETAQMLRVAPITIRRYIADGRLPAVKVGKGVRVRRESIDVTLDLFIEPFRGDSIEFGQVFIQHHAMSTDEQDGSFNAFRGNHSLCRHSGIFTMPARFVAPLTRISTHGASSLQAQPAPRGNARHNLGTRAGC